MSKPTLLLQFRTDESIDHERQMIMKFGHFSQDTMKIINVLDPEAHLPRPADLDNYNGVITGASGQFNITDWNDDVRLRVEQLVPFFEEIIKRDFPTLAICFGHQLIAKLLGGEVERDDKISMESGTYPVTLTEEGKKSKLYRHIPSPFYVVSAHKDSVTKLPNGAVLLAYSERCGIHSYRFGEHIFATQFHAELDREALLWRLQLYPEYLNGKTLDEIRDQFDAIPDAPKIIENFAEWCKKMVINYG